MTLFEITNETRLRTAAVTYLMQGLSVIPVTGKKTMLDWKIYQKQRARTADLGWWEQSGLLKNLAIVCGAVSNNLMVLDLDGEWAVSTFDDLFPSLLDTFTVTSGSGRGKHLYFFVDDLSPTTKYSRGDGHNGIELRSNGAYIVAPPSIHPDSGKPYEISVKRPIRRFQQLHYLKAWLDGLNHQSKAIPARIQRQPTIVKAGQAVLRDKKGDVVGNPVAYARAALNAEANRLTAQNDHRNDHINLSAYRMGQFVQLGYLTTSEVENALYTAARRWSDMSEREIRATIRSGLTSGSAGEVWRDGV
jgi:hypothetical protein